MSVLTSSPSIRTLAVLLDRLGNVPADRVRFYPMPGTATEQDVVDIEAHENRLCELIDGVLVEKPMGYDESLIAGNILTALNQFAHSRKLGLVTGEARMVRLFPGMVRIPDVAFVSKGRLPGGRKPVEPIPSLIPDLVVEVLSESNTTAEMSRKRGEYFTAGVRLMWVVDPASKTVAVYTTTGSPRILRENQTLDGGEVLPGFSLDLKTIFADPLE